MSLISRFNTQRNPQLRYGIAFFYDFYWCHGYVLHRGGLSSEHYSTTEGEGRGMEGRHQARSCGIRSEHFSVAASRAAYMYLVAIGVSNSLSTVLPKNDDLIGMKKAGA